jgi:uncharacterized membrane protein YgdD (TMEM256/DUF423 family)
MTVEKTNTLPLPPPIGGIALVGGIIWLVTGNKKNDGKQSVSATRRSP